MEHEQSGRVSFPNTTLERRLVEHLFSSFFLWIALLCFEIGNALSKGSATGLGPEVKVTGSRVTAKQGQTYNIKTEQNQNIFWCQLLRFDMLIAVV